MFGYIIVNKQELKFREFDVYQSYYCGLCQSLKERFGRRGQLTLSYDMTFVALLLSALYDEPVESSTCKCVAHPFEAHATSRSVFTDYAADMNLLLSYYKCLDDWTDERKWKGRLRAAALRGRDKMVEARYPEKAEHIYTLLEHIHLYEKAQEPDVDLASGCFGEIMGESSPVGRMNGKTTCAGWVFPRKVYLSDGCLRGYGKGRKRRQLQRIFTAQEEAFR